VVRVQGHVQPHQLDKRGVVSVSKHGSKVGGPVLGGVDSGDLAVTVDVLVDPSGDDGELGEEVHRVFVLRTGRVGSIRFDSDGDGGLERQVKLTVVFQYSFLWVPSA